MNPLFTEYNDILMCIYIYSISNDIFLQHNYIFIIIHTYICTHIHTQYVWTTIVRLHHTLLACQTTPQHVIPGQPSATKPLSGAICGKAQRPRTGARARCFLRGVRRNTRSVLDQYLSAAWAIDNAGHIAYGSWQCLKRVSQPVA